MESAGTAAPLILVHGAWHDRHCWDAVRELLQARNLTVDCPDLPGHGDNALPLHKVSARQYLTALLDLLDAAPEPVVLVGHSMAGNVVTEAACKRPDKIRHVVYLCAYLPRPGESIFDLIVLNRGHEPMCPIELALELAADKRSCTIEPEQVIPLFYNDVPAALAQQLSPRLRAQATLPLSAAARFDQDVFATLDSVYICCTRDRVIPLHHQRRMLARQPCKTLLQIESDHSPFYSCPEQLAELLMALCQR